MAENRLVHIVDDEEAVRRSLAMLAESAGRMVMTHPSGDAFLDAADLAEAGCVVTDMRMPGISGLELLAEVRDREPGLPVIVVTGHGDVKLAVRALKAGAHDFIEKPFDTDDFLASIDEALEQRDASRAGRLEQAELEARRDRLTSREREVMDMIVGGLANAETAQALGISVRTVENHRARVMDKMEAARLSDLVRMGLRLREL